MTWIDTKAQRQISAQLQRVLIVEPSPAPTKLLGELIRSMGGQELHWAIDQDGAMEACAAINPQLIFTEFSGPALDGLGFVRALRRSAMACRQAPVILVTSEATTQTITAARDVGVHEFLRKPFTIGDLTKRLEAVILRSRAWIEAMDYVGPDRRRFNSAEYSGVRKRKTDGQPGSPAERAKQALQILASAMGGIESDPMQALRSMAAQVVELQAVAIQTDNGALGHAALQLDHTLKAAARGGQFSRRDFEACAAALGRFMPQSDAASDRRAPSRGDRGDAPDTP